MPKAFLTGFICLILMETGVVTAQTNPGEIMLQRPANLGIDMQWFLSYLRAEESQKCKNEFTLKRGYVNIKKRINDSFSGRITTDITVDKEGDGEGDVEVRLKYLYLKYEIPNFAVFYKPYFEFGLVHCPWLDFEQHINLYRVQGTLFLERNNVVSSGDYGVVFLGLLGGAMDPEYRKKINDSYAGKWGSVAFGIFNGGGYHALEKNNNKVFQSRVTLRPLVNVIPGLQLTYHNALGKGNIAQAPNWRYHSGYASYESRHLILTAEYYTGKGNYKGSAIQDTLSFNAVPQKGYSFFGEWKLFDSRVSIIGRYDCFTQSYNSGEVTARRAITGIAFHFIRHCKWLVDYDYLDYANHPGKYSRILEMAIELQY
ncbi:hypothetical protein JXO59_09765 [candidate division KSB1 bacterium]|nr:hypothetical protein [candidate division KSB1 bacterium]